jgi:hypothetical protein
VTTTTNETNTMDSTSTENTWTTYDVTTTNETITTEGPTNDQKIGSKMSRQNVYYQRHFSFSYV